MIGSSENEVWIILEGVSQNGSLEEFFRTLEKGVQVSRRESVRTQYILEVGDIRFTESEVQETGRFRKNDLRFFSGWGKMLHLNAKLSKELGWKLGHTSDTCRKGYVETGFRAGNRDKEESPFFLVLFRSIDFPSRNTLRKGEFFGVPTISPNSIERSGNENIFVFQPL